MRAFLLAAALAAAGSPTVSIQVAPRLVMEGQPLRITCKVPRHPDNRKLEIGLLGMKSSTFPLNGEAGAVTNNLFIAHADCGVGPAYCLLSTVTGQEKKVTFPVKIVGMNCPSEDDAAESGALGS